MLDLKNIILVFIILFLLNQIKYTKQIKKNKNDNKNKKKVIEKISSVPKIKDKKLLYGEDQFIINSTFDNNKKLYQNLNVLKPNNNLELTSNLKFNYDQNNDAYKNTIDLNRNDYDNRNLVHKLDDLNFTNLPLTKEQIINNYNNENLKGVITIPLNNIDMHNHASPSVMLEEPISQKMLYDYRFLDMNKNELEEIIKNDETNMFEGKTIKEVYDGIIFDYKKINQKKNPINKNINTDGAFGESALPVDQWYYDGEINELSFDPSQTLELAVPIQNTESDDY
jgi:hypothetical protein